MTKRTEAKIRDAILDSSDAVTRAGQVLIGLVRRTEIIEGDRTTRATLSLEIELTGGGVETWEITIERTASSH